MREFVHPVFGPLRQDSESGEWTGSLEVGDAVVELRLETDGEEQIPPEYEEMFRLLHPKLVSLQTDAVKWIISDLPHWLESGEDRSIESLSRQMRISAVEIYSGTGASVWFHGPDTIHESGHVIEGRFGENAALAYFCLAG